MRRQRSDIWVRVRVRARFSRIFECLSGLGLGLGLEEVLGLGLGFDLHFAVWVSVLLSTRSCSFFQHVVREREVMLYFIWFHWMRRCNGAWVGAAEKLQGRGGRRVGGAALEQQGSCGGRSVVGAAEGLQRRGCVLECLVCTVDSNADIDAGWRLGRPDLGVDMSFDTIMVRGRARTRARAQARARARSRVGVGLGLGLGLGLGRGIGLGVKGKGQG